MRLNPLSTIVLVLRFPAVTACGDSMPCDAFKPPFWQRTLDPGGNDGAGFCHGIRPDCFEKEEVYAMAPVKAGCIRGKKDIIKRVNTANEKK